LPSAFWRPDVCLNCFSLFGECVCINCFDCCLVSTSQMKPRFHRLLLVWCEWEIPPSLWYHYKKAKAEAILCVWCAAMNIFGSNFAQNLW
jgi:hypothetical protein